MFSLMKSGRIDLFLKNSKLTLINSLKRIIVKYVNFLIPIYISGAKIGILIGRPL